MPAIWGYLQHRLIKYQLFLTFTYQGEAYALVDRDEEYTYITRVERRPTVRLFEFAYSRREIDEYILEDSHALNIRELSDKLHLEVRELACICLYIRGLGLEIPLSTLEEIQQLDKESIDDDGHLGRLSDARIVHLDLGEKDPDLIIASLSQHQQRAESSSTMLVCINKLTGYMAENVDGVLMDYFLLHQKEAIITDPILWRLMIGFKSYHLNKSTEKERPLSDTRQLSSLERAVNYVRLREYRAVRLTLFSSKVNELSASSLHSIGVLLGEDDELLAYKSLKPNRLLFHFMLAYVSVLGHDESQDTLFSKIKSLSRKFITENEIFFEEIENERKNINKLIDAVSYRPSFLSCKDERKHGAQDRLKHLQQTLANSDLTDEKAKQTLYHLDMPFEEVARTVLFYELFHAYLRERFHEAVSRFVKQAIHQGVLRERRVPKGIKQHYIGMTGGVASGKSATEKEQKALLPEGEPVRISSDDWNLLLTDFLGLELMTKERGMLSLGEAWFIKNLIWDVLEQKAQEGFAPHIIQEAMSPCSLRIPKEAKACVVVNTACPLKAVRRMDRRYQMTGRYVPIENTLSSYRNLWLDVLRCVSEKQMGTAGSQIALHVIDTDQFYAGDKSPILRIADGRCEIVSLHRFISFVNRSYMMSQTPKSIYSVWRMKQMALDMTQKEVEKLFDKRANLAVYCHGEPVSVELLKSLVEKQFNAAKTIQKHVRAYLKRPI